MTPPCQTTPARSGYLRCLAWAFALFNSARLVAYLPTVWALQTSADSNQHSLWTWAIFCGANLTMAAWLYEQNGRRPNRAVCVNVVNTLMCAWVLALIAQLR